MPVGKELGAYTGKFSSVRICEVNGDQQIAEGSYTAKVSGEISGTAVGTMTFNGTNERGTYTELGVGYLDSGDVTTYKAHGVYWFGGKGKGWQTRAAVVMGEQTLVAEGEIKMSDGVFSLSGKVAELK